MVNSDLHDFLSGKSGYQEALDLIKKYQLANTVQMRTFQAAESKYNLRSMTKLIIQFASKSEPEKQIQKKESNLKDQEQKKSRRKSRYSDGDLKKLPPDLQDLHASIKGMYGKRSSLHAELRLVNYTKKMNVRKNRNQKQSDRICHDILSIQDLISSAWERIDYFMSHGEYMKGTEPLQESDRLIYWLKNVVSYTNYIRKYRNDSKRPNEELYKYRLSVLTDIKNFVDTNG